MTKHWFIAHLIKKFTNNKNLGLDIGIGKDNWKEFKKTSIIGVDINRNSNAEIISDLEKPLPFKDEIFDVVIAINSANYIKNSRQLFQEINRVMKYNGILLCIVDNPNSKDLPENTWDQKYLNRIIQVSGFKHLLQNNFREFFYSKWYNYTSVYAFAVAKKVKTINLD